jgi:rod shape determining protein RodA
MADSLRLSADPTIIYKLKHLNWGMVLLLSLLAGIGFLSLYSAGGGQWDPWAGRHITRYAMFVVMMIGIALIDIRFWYRMAYPIYAIGFVLLIIVEIMGHVGMGAQRWINLGFIQIQPSELMKIAVVLALARMFHSATIDDMRSLRFLMLSAILIVAPVGLVLLQPNLGTAVILIALGGAMLFLAGAPIWIFLAGIGGVVAAVPVVYTLLHDYQRRRVDTFLNPESDPLGAGYNIIQSKIALGSGGIEGKGFLNGTQSHLNFLPEKQTDFIFTLWAEEWGLIGGAALLALLGAIFLYGIILAHKCRHGFGRLLALGLTVNFSLYAFINIAMVMGLIPVVGIPLPLVSYGGTAMMAAMIGFGLILSCSIHRDVKLPRM